jgi:hypothetical protein
MTEEPIIIEMNIAHYGAMLKLNLDDENRSIVKHLLAEATKCLTLALAARR